MVLGSIKMHFVTYTFPGDTGLVVVLVSGDIEFCTGNGWRGVSDGTG